MERDDGVSQKIEAEMCLDIGRVQLVRNFWNAPIDKIGCSADHHLELSLLPRSNAAMGCFPDHWGPHRFEPIGEMFFFPAGLSVHSKSECRHQNSVICAFDPEAAAGYLDDRLEWTDRRLQSCLDIANADIRRLMFRIGEEIRNPGFAGETLVALMASQVAIELSRHFTGMDESKGAAGGLSPWRLRLIDERLTESHAPPSLAELAALCNLSVRHLTRAFRISRGRSISAFVAEHRMDHAKRLLASGTGIKSVAHAMGFTAPSNFTAAFRRATGETPREYRQRANRRQVEASTLRRDMH